MKNEGCNTKRADLSARPRAADMDRLPRVSPAPELRNHGGRMRPAEEGQHPGRPNNTERAQGVSEAITTSLSTEAETFFPKATLKNPTTSRLPPDNELDRSPPGTSPGKSHKSHDVIERDTLKKPTTSRLPPDNELDRSPPGTSPRKSNKSHDVIEMVSAMDGTAYPSRMDRPVAVADSAGAGGPAVTMDGTAYPSRMDKLVTMADSSGAGGPVVAGTCFLAVAEVYSPNEEMKDDPPKDVRIVTRTSNALEEDVGSHPLEHSGVDKRVGPSYGPQRIRPLEHYDRPRTGN